MSRFAAFAPLILCGLGGNAALAKDPALLSLAMEHFRDTATVVNEPLDAKLTISTQNGFVEHSGPLHMVWHDESLTEDIDKKTGEKSFKVHEEISYGGTWRYYESATYPSVNGPRSAPAVHISKEAANCSVGDCLYTEHVAFPIEEELLRQLAAAHGPPARLVGSISVLAVWRWRPPRSPAVTRGRPFRSNCIEASTQLR